MKRYMKRILSLMLALATLFLFAQAALGDGSVQLVNWQRMTAGLLPGMEQGVAVTCTDGHMDIVIDVSKVDWNQTIAYGYDAGSGNVYIRPGFNMPDALSKAPAYMVSFGTGSDAKDQDVLDILKVEEANQNGRYNDARLCDNGWELGRYVEDSGLFVPNTSPEGGLVCRWYDANKQEILTERMSFKISFSESKPISVLLNQVSEDRIVPMPDEADRDKITIVKNDGFIRYTVNGVQTLNSQTVPTLVRPPKQAKDSWACRYQTNSGFPMIEGNMQADGSVMLWPFFGNMGAYLLEWYDTRDNSVQYLEKLTYTLTDTSEKPWPNYDYTDVDARLKWEPVPAENVTVNEMEIRQLGKQMGISVTYGVHGEGMLHFAPDEELLSKSREIGKAYFNLFVKVPEGALYYSENHSGGNNIFGKEVNMITWQDNFLRQVKERQPVPGNGIVRCRSGYQPVRRENVQGGTSVYLAGEMTTEFAGGITAIYWYDSMDADAEPIAMQYVVDKQEPFVLIREEKELHKKPGKRLTIPLVHIDGLRADHPYVLSIEYYPQEGESSFYYELQLMNDQTGEKLTVDELRRREKLDPNKPFELYIPYPENYGKDTQADYRVRHYTADHSWSEEYNTGRDKDDPLYLELTDYGVCMRVNGLSPYEFSWGNGSAGGGEDGGCGDCMVEIHGHHLIYDYDSEDPNVIVEVCIDGQCEACRDEHRHHVADARLSIEPSIPYGEPVEAEVFVSDNWLGRTPNVLYRPADAQPDPDMYSSEPPVQPGQYATALEVRLGKGESIVLDMDVFFSILPNSQEGGMAVPGGSDSMPAPEEIDLPKTGDNMPQLRTLLALLTASVGALFVLRRRESKA